MDELTHDEPSTTSTLLNYPMEQKILILFWLIKLSLVDMKEHCAILLSGEEDLNQKILRLRRRIFDGLTLIYSSIIEVRQQLFSPHLIGSSFSHTGRNDEDITCFFLF